MIHALTFATYAITLDGKPVLPHARAAVVDNRVLLPVRALGNALRADVGYDGRARTITVQRGAHVATISARGAVRIVKGSAYAPLRVVANAFGMDVAYDGLARTIALAQRAEPVAAAPTVIVGDAVRPPLTVTVSPAANAHVHDPYPSISARFAGAASIDPHSLQVRIDERDVSADTSVLGDQVLITPRTALMPGTHVVTISGRDITGAAIAQQWAFVDTFAFSTAPPPVRFPVSAIWIDRWVTPGTNAFDVYVQGVPGMTGYVGIDGVGSYFPLQVYTANAYVAHVVVPDGVNQPFARIAARMTFPNGVQQTIVLPQTINLSTPPLIKPMIVVTPSPVPKPSPRAVPTRRSVDVPAPSPTAAPTERRSVLTTTPAPLPRTPAPSHAPFPSHTPAPFRTPVPPPLPAPSVVPPAALTATPEPVRTRRPLIRRTPSPSPTPA
ncbi:MAG TPA: stalk domain-containing protein [Xanthomonadales bacterium]|nr:stalk domain-containing protein [Xanthomonadales bacterium]